MKKAFTLVEILLCMVIIGVIAVVMVQTIKTKDFTEKSYIANALKIMDNIEQASLKIRELEKTNCPMGMFMINIMDTWEYALVNSSGNSASATDVINLYAKYLKFENTGLKFCDHTGYCSNDDIIGAKIHSDSFIGFEITSTEDCPNYYMPGSDTLTNGKGKCWGKLYMDVNGTKGPDELGKDVFIFGMNEIGIAY